MAQFDTKKVVLKFLDWLESTGRSVGSKNVDRSYISRVIAGSQNGSISPEKLGEEIVRALGLDGTISTIVGKEREELERIIGKERKGIL